MSGEPVKLHPLPGHACLLDDPVESCDGGIVVRKEYGCLHMDFYVIRVSDGAEFAVGDRVLLSGPNVGRRIVVDGTPYRIVKNEDIVALLD